ncbi:probable DNA primase large subunit [Quercus lobata]|uniref:probable DNA primase large subunit n=1 Tax=Quercus lobata TaxID=97700 RepID=UPI001248A673|nr:probable DNA primase large subunit [Quercus lobata]
MPPPIPHASPQPEVPSPIPYASPQPEVPSPSPPLQPNFDVSIDQNVTPPILLETPSYPPTGSTAPTPDLYIEHDYPPTASSSDPLGPPVGIDTPQPHTDVPDEHPPHQPSPPRDRPQRTRKAPTCGTGGHKIGHRGSSMEITVVLPISAAAKLLFPFFRTKLQNATKLKKILQDSKETVVESDVRGCLQFTNCSNFLKGIANGLSRGKKSEEMKNLADHLWKAKMRHPDAFKVVNKDIISHFVLRLVYCKTEDLRKWFLSMETILFRYQLLFERPETQRALMAEFNLPYRAASNAELESVKEGLKQVAQSFGQPLAGIDTECNIYLCFFPTPMKVPFEEVPELVAGGRVFIHKGYAYIAMNQVVSLVATQFRSDLSKALILTNRKWTSTIREQEKDRLTPIVQALCSSYLGPDHSQPREFAEISIKDIDQIAKNSFPLCMRHLFEKLREDHHLKHGGRMQLGLFLKGVGLKLEDALAFWKAEFSQRISMVGSERFDKEYAYSIRHNYGREGKRTDYTPYSCQTIITSAPGVGDHHGCPYRHFSEENVRAALGKMGITNRAVEDVMDKVRNIHYQLACTLKFEAVNGTSCDAGINHPNQYFSDSQKVLQSKNTRMEKPNLDELYHVFTSHAIKFIDYRMMGDGSKSESWKEFKTSCLGNFAKNLVRKSLGQGVRL